MSDEEKARDALAGLALAMSSDPDKVRKKMTGIWYMLKSDAMEMIATTSSINQEVQDRFVVHLDENLVVDDKDRCDVLEFGMTCGDFMGGAHSLEEMQAIRKLLFEFHDIPKYEYK